MQTTDNKEFGEYRVTEADICVFSNLLDVWKKITEANKNQAKSAADIKLWREYANQLSQLDIGDKIIASWEGMKLEALHSKTQYYSLQLHSDSDSVKSDIKSIQAKCTVTQKDLEEYQLPQLLDIITKAKTGQSYIEYIN